MEKLASSQTQNDYRQVLFFAVGYNCGSSATAILSMYRVAISRVYIQTRSHFVILRRPSTHRVENPPSVPMAETPRVVLSVIPFTGFDRGLLDGIARYAQFHGPWVFYFSGDYPDVPVPIADSVSGEFSGPEYVAKCGFGSVSQPGPLEGHGGDRPHPIEEDCSKGLGFRFAGGSHRLVRRAVGRAESVVEDFGNPRGFTAGRRLGAEHFLERGFRHFAFCGFAGRFWSQQRLEGFSECLGEAGFSCNTLEAHGVDTASRRRETTR